MFLAVYSPPNNYDAHWYHLTRVLLWIDNENLNHFPTQFSQQLYLNVFAEYVTLDTMLLSESDRYIGLVQYGSYVGSLAAISLLAKRFGANASGQILAATFLLTLPIGIFESTSAQVDLVACYFFICFVYFGFDLLEKRSVVTLVAFLTALSLGGFTKYTVFIFAIPFTVYFAVRLLSQYGFVYSLKVLLLSLAILLLTFTPFLLRNYNLFGHILSPPLNSRLFSEKIPADQHSFSFTISNVIKNASLHMGIPSTGVNLLIQDKITNLHQSIGVNINEPAISIDQFSVRYSVHEDMMPNTIHFWLIGLSIIGLLFFKGRWKIKWLILCAVAGFVLFSTLLKFQLWSSRTQMPFFAVGAILVTYLYTQALRWRTVYLIVPLLLLSVGFVFGNPNKPIVPVSYLVRKAIAHIPISICATDKKEEQVYKKYLEDYYTFPAVENCHPLKELPGYQKRAEIFNILDQLGYYDDVKSSTVFKTDRVKALFLSHLDNYYSFEPLLKHIDNNSNIGVLYEKGLGFFHYWSALNEKFENPGKMHYIRYKRELATLENAQKPFCYDYILCDDLTLLKGFVPEENIDTVYQEKTLSLVKLKSPSCARQLF
ncbi:glycosyltransferase family 39 protein [Telluribacter humicola]|uniref:glycosyltransferase family 39 protein n=1 Tax=Telluribacter humicola TaxID=1720261 RepID=UPI001E63CCBA|nr:glycosyltransferase family 39 protein [Telluribacter humicola]